MFSWDNEDWEWDSGDYSRERIDPWTREVASVKARNVSGSHRDRDHLRWKTAVEYDAIVNSLLTQMKLVSLSDAESLRDWFSA